MKSYKEQLEEIQKAISDILSGAQEASYNGQKVKKSGLKCPVYARKVFAGQSFPRSKRRRRRRVRQRHQQWPQRHPCSRYYSGIIFLSS